MEYYGAPSSQFLPRALFVILLCLCMVAVSIPLLIFIHRTFWLIWVLAGCLVTSITSLVSVRSRRARPLTNLEKFLLLPGVLFNVSAVALVVLAGFMPAGLLSLTFGSASISARILWYVGVAIASFFLLGGLVAVAGTLLEAFFPGTGVGNASLFPGFTWRKIALPGLLSVLAIALLALAASFGWSYAYVAMIIVLMIVSAPVSTALDRQKHSAVNPPTFEVVKVLLDASGYKIFDRLQTGELSLDRLIALFDIVAHKDGNALAIQFKTSASSSEPVMWTEVSSVRTAVWAIYRGAEKQQVPMASIQPVLVLFGRTADPNLTEFCQAESIVLVELPSDAPLERIAKREFTPEQLRELAKLYLPVSLGAYGTGQTAPGLPAESTA